jgi:hypothetical protein
MKSREYTDRTVSSDIERARDIPRHIALRKVIKRQESKRPVFALTYDPRLPQVQAIQAKHWRSMVSQDPYLHEVFSQPPLTAYKRQKNVKDHLVRAKVPGDPRPYPERTRRGMKKCGNNCTACPFIKEVKSLRVEWSRMED